MHRHFHWVWCVLVLFLAASCMGGASSSNRPEEFSQVIPADLPLLGMGFEELENRFTGYRCFEGLPIRSVSRSEARLVEQTNVDANQISEALNASLTVGFPVYPGVTVKGGLGLSQNFAANAFRQNSLVHLEVVNLTQSIEVSPDNIAERAQLTENALRVSNGTASFPAGSPSPAQALRALCGTSFVHAIEYGYSITSVLSIEAADSAGSQQLAGMLGAQIGAGPFTANLEVTTSITRALRTARARLELFIIQQGGAPSHLLSKLLAKLGDLTNTLETPMDAGNVRLRCSVENWESCLALHHAVSEYAREVRNDLRPHDDDPLPGSSNLLPLRYDTQPYLPLGAMKQIVNPNQDRAVLEQERQHLNSLRRQVLSLQAQHASDLRRLRENLERQQGQRESIKVADLEQAVRNAQGALSELEKIVVPSCWSEGSEVSHSDSCSAALLEFLENAKYGGKFFYRPTLLEASPGSKFEWCMLALVNGGTSLSSRDASTMHALLDEVKFSETPLPIDEGSIEITRADTLTDEELQDLRQALDNLPQPTPTPAMEPTAPSTGREWARRMERPSDTCKTADQWWSHMQAIHWERNNAAPIQSLAPLATFSQLQKIIVKGQGLTDVSPLAGLKNIHTLDLAQNQLADLDAFSNFVSKTASVLNLSENFIEEIDVALSRESFPWKEVDLSNNKVTFALRAPLAPNLEKLNLSGNPLVDVSGLAGITKEKFVLVLKDTDVRCPFPQTPNRRCEF